MGTYAYVWWYGVLYCVLTNIGEVLHGGLHLVVGQGLEPHDHDSDVLLVAVEPTDLVITRSPGVPTAQEKLFFSF